MGGPFSKMRWQDNWLSEGSPHETKGRTLDVPKKRKAPGLVDVDREVREAKE
jgi:hypothetical protein